MEPYVPLLILTALVLLPLIWFVAMYNVLVRLRNHCDEAWSDVDSELKRRYDLIPNLVETVKGYAAHERQVLERVIEARNTAFANHGTPGSQARDENALVAGLRHLIALAERYPVLKADANFRQLQDELVNTEDRLQRARRFYNANVRDYNNRVQSVPSNLVAGLFSFQQREFFEVDQAVRATPDVTF